MSLILHYCSIFVCHLQICFECMHGGYSWFTTLALPSFGTQLCLHSHANTDELKTVNLQKYYALIKSVNHMIN